MKRLAKHRRIVSSLLLALIILILVAAPFLFYKGFSVFPEKITKIELSLYIAQIVSAVFVSIGVLIALWQYFVVSKSETTKAKADRIERAIKMAEFYKNEILEYYTVIKFVYQEIEVFDLFQKERSRMKKIDEEELLEIFGEKGKQTIKEKLHSNKLIEAIVQASEISGLQINGCVCRIVDEENGKSKKAYTIDRQKVFFEFMENYVSKLLNNMEYFAMYFTHNIADESVVYQSLSLTYIEMCRTLYYDIAICSPKGAPKLYRNLQELYDQWSEKSEALKREMSKHENSKGTVY